ncbi:MAG TPA: CBS domain-containing protein [Candidatus Atopostipes pullistercoris]|uniref:CBS domain-containing protein n=1 Tax=Candidatus Atopostipes pullistercoris TaxID=2838467 RepID=A0A9D2G0U0_9LACT|nr:CBS domain-containing protein [Candidatus Atopostipes pullistercoris]
MELSERQKEIIEIVKQKEPISGDNIAEALGLSKSTLRSDLAVLTMIGILDARPKVGYIYSGLNFEPLIQDRLASLTVKDRMAPPVIINQETTIQDAITTLFMYDAGTLVVADQATNDMVGIVSRKDLLRSMVMGNNQEAAVALIMTRMPNIYVTYPKMPILKAAELISRHEVDTLPVVKSKNSKEVIGKISKTILVNLLIEVGNEGDSA